MTPHYIPDDGALPALNAMITLNEFRLKVVERMLDVDTACDGPPDPCICGEQLCAHHARHEWIAGCQCDDVSCPARSGMGRCRYYVEGPDHEQETEAWRLWLRDRYVRGEIELDEFERSYAAQLRDPQPAPPHVRGWYRLPPPSPFPPFRTLPEERSHALTVSGVVVWFSALTALVLIAERVVT